MVCLSIHNLFIFWSLRAEILNTLTSKVYKLIHMMRQIETQLYIDKLQFVFFGKFQEKGKMWQKISTKNSTFYLEI